MMVLPTRFLLHAHHIMACIVKSYASELHTMSFAIKQQKDQNDFNINYRYFNNTQLIQDQNIYLDYGLVFI